MQGARTAVGRWRRVAGCRMRQTSSGLREPEIQTRAEAAKLRSVAWSWRNKAAAHARLCWSADDAMTFCRMDPDSKDCEELITLVLQANIAQMLC